MQQAVDGAGHLSRPGGQVQVQDGQLVREREQQVVLLPPQAAQRHPFALSNTLREMLDLAKRTCVFVCVCRCTLFLLFYILDNCKIGFQVREDLHQSTLHRQTLPRQVRLRVPQGALCQHTQADDVLVILVVVHV